MRVVIILSLVAVVFLSAASAVKKPPRSCLPTLNCGQYGIRCPGRYTCIKNRCCLIRNTCSSGIVGPSCKSDRHCKKGYKCKGGRCCMVCPDGRREGGRCSLTPGKPKCKFGYDCVYNNLCCRSRVIPGPIRVCPRVRTGIFCPLIRVRPACIKDRDCGKGKLCCPGRCGRRYCTRGVPGNHKG